ncbi:PREDICTED: uncharacterized protein LOC104751456 [Camelina sativa]|uniref:Uncharacterized protein LOC104751456 n=1 Tax=Camelina sativa TaxID=90675 RepID=A0ABM0WIW0_CAMSA|nr:PREDICTED: uncharacterized protein LOC104751456 [Camelina sativa]
MSDPNSSQDENDPARKHGFPDPVNRNKWQCRYCPKITCGGITRLKQYLVGGYRNATKCPDCLEHIREEIISFMKKKEQLKASTQMMPPSQEFDDYDDVEEMDCEPSNKRQLPQPKKPRYHGPLDRFVTSTPPDILNARKERKRIFGACDKELREKTRYCKGSVFLKSLDVSEVVKDATLLFQLLDKIVKEVGDENVVQVVTDNASNFVKAAHCIDLMLEDIGKIANVKSYTKVNLHRPAITRFATTFITLAQFHKQKDKLRKMVHSEEWNNSKWPKEIGGKKLASPLVQVLRMVDRERKPPMGYMYAAMDRAKETVMKSFNMREEHYKTAFEIIDKRLEFQLHRPLHAAGYFLNPKIQYGKSDDVGCEEVLKDEFKNATGLFGYHMAIRHRATKSPAEWWSSYGSSTPHLQKIAIKVLSLTCSGATGSERNWGVFQLMIRSGLGGGLEGWSSDFIGLLLIGPFSWPKGGFLGLVDVQDYTVYLRVRSVCRGC